MRHPPFQFPFLFSFFLSKCGSFFCLFHIPFSCLPRAKLKGPCFAVPYIVFCPPFGLAFLLSVSLPWKGKGRGFFAAFSYFFVLLKGVFFGLFFLPERAGLSMVYILVHLIAKKAKKSPDGRCLPSARAGLGSHFNSSYLNILAVIWDL